MSKDFPSNKDSKIACLECRLKHLRCTGDQPRCRRCSIKNLECSYVKGKRGGARIKGVKLKEMELYKQHLAQQHNSQINIYQQQQNSPTTSESSGIQVVSPNATTRVYGSESGSDPTKFSDENGAIQNSFIPNVNTAIFHHNELAMANIISPLSHEQHQNPHQTQLSALHYHEHPHQLRNQPHQMSMLVQQQPQIVLPNNPTDMGNSLSNGTIISPALNQIPAQPQSVLSHQNSVSSINQNSPAKLGENSGTSSTPSSIQNLSLNDKDPYQGGNFGNQANGNIGFSPASSVSNNSVSASHGVHTSVPPPPPPHTLVSELTQGPHPSTFAKFSMHNPPSDISGAGFYSQNPPIVAGDNELEFIDRDRIHKVVEAYYSSIHNAHPFLPAREDIRKYFTSMTRTNDIVLCMQLISDGQAQEGVAYTEEQSATIDEKVHEILSYIENYELDLVSLQSLFLLALVAHLCALHETSGLIRKKALKLITQLDVNLMDSKEFPQLFNDILDNRIDRNDKSEKTMKLLQSPRFINVDNEVIKECARKVFWELYTFDILMGLADGVTVSELTNLPTMVQYPVSPPREVFDYQSRAECTALMNKAIRLNGQILKQQPNEMESVKLKASLGNWELKLKNPVEYGLPALMNRHGVVNEGVYQATAMYLYAKIFFHRPLSFIYKPESIPQQPNCGRVVSHLIKCGMEHNLELEDEKVFKVSGKNIFSTKLIETRKLIAAANDMISLLIDSQPGDIRKRSPLVICNLAYAGMVHFSVYVWIEALIKRLSEVNETNLFSQNELFITREYLQMEISLMHQMGKHWYLASKIFCYLNEVVKQFLPLLFEELKERLPIQKPVADQAALDDGTLAPVIICSKSPASYSSNSMDLLPSSLKMGGLSSRISDDNGKSEVIGENEPASPNSTTSYKNIDDVLDFFGEYDFDFRLRV